MSARVTRRLVNNFAFLTVGYFFVRLITMAATLYIARALGPGDFGGLSSGVNIALVLGVVANLGLADYLVLAIARAPEDSNALLGDAFQVKIIVLPFALLGAVLLRFYDPEFGLLFFIMIIHGLFHSYLLLFWAVFRGLERMEFQTLLMIMQAVITAVGSTIVIWLTRNATLAAVVYMIASISTVVVGYLLLLKKGIRPTYRWRLDAWKKLLKTALPFGMIFVYLIIFDRLPAVLLPLLSPKADAGWFNSVYTITTVLVTIPSVIMAVVFPLMARESQQSLHSVGQISNTVIKSTIIIGLGLAFTLFIMAPWLIPFLFGDAYLPSITIMQILAISIPFTFLIITLINMLEAVGQQHICARYTGYTLLFAVPVCVVFVWQWGYLGSAVAYLINNVLLATLLLWLVGKMIGNVRLKRAALLPFMAGLVPGLSVYFLRQWPFYALLPVVILLYLVLLLVTGAIGAPEMEMVRKVLQSRSKPQPASASGLPLGNEDGSNLP